MSFDGIRCFVPNCNNTVGVPLPQDLSIIEEYLETFQVKGPIDSEYICLQHYENTVKLKEALQNVNVEVGVPPENPQEQLEETGTIENCENNVQNGIGEQLIVDTENVQDTDSEKLDLHKICRLCMSKDTELTDIFQDVEEEVPIFVSIVVCIHPLKISKDDHLPQQICTNCIVTLKSYFKFRSCCLQNDKTLRTLYEKNAPSNRTKRKAEDEPIPECSKRTFYISDSENEDSISSSSFNNVIEQSKSSESERLDSVETELRKVLEDSEVENIIIRIENEEENNEEINDKVATLTELKLPIVIKPIPPKKEIVQKKNINLVNAKSNEINKKVQIKNVQNGSGFRSNVGIFEGRTIMYVYNLEFCIVDGYLFEHRLCKGDLRYLRCILPSCTSVAVQEKIKDGLYSNAIKVRKSHNHKKPSQEERKKQMFFYVIRRKLQSDKSLNFRNVYEEVCEQHEEMKILVPLKSVVNEICRNQLAHKIPTIHSFQQFFDLIEDDRFYKLQFTQNGKQFYQEKFITEDNSQAVIFAHTDIIEQVLDSHLMYVDASFKIDTNESFQYQLLTVLVWVDDSYYPILFALVSCKSQAIYKNIFEYLHDTLAPKLRPEEIVTDYEANLFHALAETYLTSSIGGSVFYYTQNLYKKVCSLNLSKDLETNSYFRNIYHMLLMLPLLPVNTIEDGLNNMETQAKELGISLLTRPIFEHVQTEWIKKVTPELFCVHRLENRINENVIAPFKKLRDFIMLSKGKMLKSSVTIVTVVEKLIDLEYFLQVIYSAPSKRSFARDLSSSQKKNVLRAWQYIENHPKININNFFTKVIGYIKCMENQLWIWGFYRHTGSAKEELINAANFSIVSNVPMDTELDRETNTEAELEESIEQTDYFEEEEEYTEELVETPNEEGQIVMEAVIDEDGGVVVEEKEEIFEKPLVQYVYKT